jgi:hypothetical protein
MKEKATQMYSTIAYLLAKFIADLPINALLSIISGTLVYVRLIIITQFLSFLLCCESLSCELL